MGTTSLNTEAKAAWRGTFKLLGAAPDAGNYFDASPRGLVGSFLALVIATALMIGFFSIGASQMAAGAPPLTMLFSEVLVYGAQAGVAWVALGLFGARDRFVPYLCADNWVSAITVFVLILTSVIGAFAGAMALGPSGGPTITAFVLTLWMGLIAVRVWLSIGILRIIAGLSGGRVAAVVVGQLVAMFILLGLLGSVGAQ